MGLTGAVLTREVAKRVVAAYLSANGGVKVTLPVSSVRPTMASTSGT